jgi:hypothetical protein
MKKTVSSLLILSVLVSLTFIQPAAAADPVTMKFGAMRLGSSWYIYAATYTSILEKELPPGSVIEVVPQGGGIANPLA